MEPHTLTDARSHDQHSVFNPLLSNIEKDLHVFENRTPVAVSLNQLEIKLKPKTNKFGWDTTLEQGEAKCLVHGINTTIQGGSLFAILGGSGSGKTTLLNVIANRVDRSSMVVEGQLLFNGAPKCRVGFVSQQDFLLPYLTVRETLTFAARLIAKAPEGKYFVPSEELVDKVILELGLKEVSNMFIGQDGVTIAGSRGISGGEKRRVSVGVQILSDPQVLCADEPTSGLDSFTAVTVIESLHRLTVGPRRTTVVASIHQPRADVFNLFDSIMLLTRGHVVYCGKTSNIVNYFTSIRAEYACPADSNSADFYVDLCSIDRRNAAMEADTRKRLRLLVKCAKDTCNKASSAKSGSFTLKILNEGSGSPTTRDNDETVKSRRHHASWATQFSSLLSRFVLNNYRNPFYLLGSVFQALEGLVIMVIFWKLSDSTQEGIQSRESLLYLTVSAENYILMIVLMERFCSEIRILDREQQDGMYSPSAYFLAHLISSIPQLVLQPLLFSVPIYFGCALRPGFQHLLIYVSITILTAFIMNGIAWLAVCVHREFSVASLIGNTSFTFLALTGGYLVNFHDLGVHINWLHYISFMNYGFQVLMINEFEGVDFPGCPYPNPADCGQWQGDAILASRNISTDEMVPSAWYLVAICVAYYLLSMALLYVVKWPPTGSAAEAGGDGSGVNDELAMVDEIEYEIEDNAVADDQLQTNDNDSSNSNPLLTANSEISNRTPVAEKSSYLDSDEFVVVEAGDAVSSPTSNCSFPSSGSDSLGSAGTNNSKQPSPQLPAQTSSSPQPQQEVARVDNRNVVIDIDNISIYVRSRRSVASRSYRFFRDLLFVNHEITTTPGFYRQVSTREANDNDVIGQEDNVDATRENIDVANADEDDQANANDATSKANPFTDEIRESVRSSFVGELLFDRKAKCVLHHVSASIKPGRLVALMGGSGSGKTTLLNLIAGRASFAPIVASPATANANKSSEYIGSGSILYNHRRPSSTQLRSMIGYVQQFDFHLPALTVWETMLFNANIRLPSTVSENHKSDRAKQVMQQLGLSICAHTIVGGDMLKGISGGEKRRLSLAVQLLANPDICLLDEPTTGLDAFTARHVVETLQELARGGRTVVLSIHQPRYDIFALLDDILLLSRGKQMWWGSAHDMIAHFSALGHPCPPLTNPADFILDITSIDFRDIKREAESRERWSYLHHAFDPTTVATDVEKQTDFLGKRQEIENGDGAGFQATVHQAQQKLSLLHTLPLLIKRSFTNQLRQPVVMSTRVSQGLFFALILCCFFAPLGYDQASVSNRVGVMYMLCSTVFLGMLNNIAIYPAERNVFYREYLDGGYSTFAFFATYGLLALPFLILTSATIAVLMMYAVGVTDTFLGFCYLTFVMFAFTITGEFVGIAFCSMFYHIGFTVNIVSVVLSIFSIMSGFLSVSAMPLTLQYINNISPVHWGSWTLANVAYGGVVFTCTPEEMLSTGVCPIATGEQVLSLYGFTGEGGRFGYSFHILVLFIITAAAGIFSFAALRWRTYKLSR